MRSSFAAAMIASAVAAVALPAMQAFAQVHPPAAAEKPIADQQAVPIKQVVLYTSGVGYFEHYGTVKGDGFTELHFKTAQINDILKSLLLEDLDKGKISSVTYGSQEPLAHTLKSFEVDLSQAPPLSALLAQLRGASVTATLGKGPVTGKILSVEQKQKPAGDKQVVTVWVLNLLLPGGSIKPIELDDITEIRLDDAKLQQELVKALSAVAAARDQDSKPVAIRFSGQGERRVRIGYVVEAPVWKASYRLVLTEDARNENPADAKDNTGKGAGADGAQDDGEKPGATRDVSHTAEQWAAADPAMMVMVQELSKEKAQNDELRKRLGPPPAGAGKSPEEKYTENLAKRIESFRADLNEKFVLVPSQNGKGATLARRDADGKAAGGSLQGWAIVENQTDSDWENVQLSLVSGRPISFVEDLYQPLYISRPVVEPELFASLRPHNYAEGLEQLQDRGGREEKAAGGFGYKPAAAAMPSPAPVAALARKQSLASDALADEGLKRAINPTRSVSSLASGASVGEFFQYTVGDVSLPRQKSAMIPIITDSVKTTRLSIYNAAVLADHPLLGARLTNTTGKLLPQGPITVLDGGSYAGDATIEDLPNTQSRLLSYGIDQNILIHDNDQTTANSLQTARLLKGVLELTHKDVFRQTYVANNKGKADRTLLIEHPKRGWQGNAKLVEPPHALETTDTLYRFEETVPAGTTKSLVVQEERVYEQGIAILPMDVGQVELYLRTAQIPDAVKKALQQAATLKHGLIDIDRQMQDRQQQMNDITTEQNRIRENMKAVAASSDYYQRLLKELDTQETQIQSLKADLKTLKQKRDDQQKALEDYLSGLNVQ